ncbi:MAG: dodecin family protein [Weeksellaceae bacterium]|jgi:flavin-binding protein dodecin
MSVLKVIEIMSSSDTSWEDATAKGLEKAGETLKGIKSAWVKDQSVQVKDGGKLSYRVTLKVSFKVD